MQKSKVFYSKEISSEALIRIYEALGVELKGKVGVKVSTGEAGAKGYLKADLIAPLVKRLNGTIIECNTAYDGKRNTVEDHMKVAEDHGFTSFAEVDIMDAEGEFKIPVKNGKHLKYDIVGDHFKNYDSILNLAHSFLRTNRRSCRSLESKIRTNRIYRIYGRSSHGCRRLS